MNFRRTRNKILRTASVTRYWLVMLLACSLCPAARGQHPPSSTLSKKTLAPFSLQGIDGREWSWDQAGPKKLVVVVFLGTECPLVKIYAPRLNSLAKRCASLDVLFLGMDSNQQDSVEELRAFKEEFGIDFPLLKDEGNKIADRFGARRTPEAFVLDAEGIVRYRGRIDDQFGVGYQRPIATREDLALAIDSLLAGKDVESPETEAPGCFIGRVRQPDDNANITWSGNVAKIFQDRCQRCHRPGEIGPFSLLDYRDTLGWIETIREVVTSNRMPPWHANPEHGTFANDSRLRDDEKRELLAWIDAGAPAGDLSKAPPPRQFSEGWQIPTPDVIIPMSNTPAKIPAEGSVEYQWYHVDSGFTEDRWVKAAEARPGSPEVVHHITVYFLPPGEIWDLRVNDRINLLGGYNPGGGPWRAPSGMAMKVPKGSKIVFEMHYTPNGAPRQDISRLGLIFARPEDVQREVHTIMPANKDFVIPPQSADYKVDVRYTFPANAEILFLRPHMHLRGKSFRYELVEPSGEREILLDVPRYDFNWQDNYVLTAPRKVSAGSVLECTAHFDNSSGNRSNPDPNQEVRWGDQSWQEMMIGIFAMVLEDQDLQVKPTLSSTYHRFWPAASVVGICLALLICLIVSEIRKGKIDGSP
ncbi:MAG: redoxin domain-containing protein [Planctomycetota bacterium]